MRKTFQRASSPEEARPKSCRRSNAFYAIHTRDGRGDRQTKSANDPTAHQLARTPAPLKTGSAQTRLVALIQGMGDATGKLKGRTAVRRNRIPGPLGPNAEKSTPPKHSLQGKGRANGELPARTILLRASSPAEVGPPSPPRQKVRSDPAHFRMLLEAKRGQSAE